VRKVCVRRGFSKWSQSFMEDGGVGNMITEVTVEKIKKRNLNVKICRDF